jgi:hypothetical protein
MHNLNRGKNNQNVWATSLIFKKLPIANNHPKGINSPNVVALRTCLVDVVVVINRGHRVGA